MKKILLVFSAAAVLVACNTTPNSSALQSSTLATPAVLDTAGLAQFRAAKQTQLLTAQASAKPEAKPIVHEKTIIKYVPAHRVAKSYSHRGIQQNSTAKATNNIQPAAAPVTMNTESANTAKAQKKGISKAAKGAIIGGVIGAGSGAMLDKKNRAMGAVIGGVIGAAGGYGIGRGMDKKDGRYFQYQQ